ncbi:MAG: hypothetical protein ABEI80_01820 [Haloplanus sp.]
MPEGVGGRGFWVERAARVVGFDHLASALFGDDRYAPYLFVSVATLVERPLPAAIKYAVEGMGSPLFRWWEWPGVLWWFVPVTLLVAVAFLRRLRSKYRHASRNVGRASGESQGIDPELPSRLQYGTLVLGLAIFAAWLSTVFGVMVVEGSPFNQIRWLLIIPLVYVPVATDLAAAYLHVQLVVPLRIRDAGVELDFADPRRLGGMYPVGQTMKFAAMAAFTALLVYTIYWLVGFTVAAGTGIIPPADPRRVTVVFALAWILSVLVLVAGVFLVHQYMQSACEERINRILSRSREIGEDEEVFPYTLPSDDSERQAYVQEYVNLSVVERTRTVPFNVAVTWELVAGAFLPLVLQIVTIGT